MELRQLRYALAVAEELHFGKAARRMNISQPPLSQQIRQLEDEIGARLFERTSRSVTLTAEGDFFIREIQAVLDRIDRAAKTVKAMAKGETGRLSIGFVVIVTQSDFPDDIREFRKKYPGIALDLKEMSTKEQLAAIENNELDIGFIRWYGHNLSGLSTQSFIREPYAMALPSSHPLADKSTIQLKDLEGETLIMFNRNYQPELYDTILHRFSEAGVPPGMIQETNRRLTAIALVAAGMGVCPVPASTKRLGREGVVYLPIADPFPEVEVVAAWSENRKSPVRDAFLAIMNGTTVKI